MVPLKDSLSSIKKMSHSPTRQLWKGSLSKFQSLLFAHHCRNSHSFSSERTTSLRYYSILSKIKKTKQKINTIQQEHQVNPTSLITPERVDSFISKQFPEKYKEMKKAEGLYSLVDHQEGFSSLPMTNIDTTTMIPPTTTTTTTTTYPNNTTATTNTTNMTTTTNATNSKRNHSISFREMLTKEERIELDLENLKNIFKKTAKHSPNHSKVCKVTIIGAPNAGKSTILNNLVRRKVSAVSPKTQTTRNRSLAVLNESSHQIVFFDTPGILNMEHSKLKVDKTAKETIEGLQDESCLTMELADVVLLMIDVTKPLQHVDHILDLLSKYAKKEKQFHLCALINKCDMVEMDRCEEYRFELIRSNVFDQAFIVSAKTGYGLESLKKYLFEKSKSRKWYFDETDGVTPSMTSRDVVAEVIREKLYRRCNKEVPYQTQIRIPKLELSPSGEYLIIDADLIVRNVGQQRIVQNALKYVNTYATADLQRMYKANVVMQFTIKVK